MIKFFWFPIFKSMTSAAIGNSFDLKLSEVNIFMTTLTFFFNRAENDRCIFIQFPYSLLLEENKKRTKADPEFEFIDTGIFNEDKYFDLFIEYAKNSEEDILMKITAHNRGKEKSSINILPQIWFRNTWGWGKIKSNRNCYYQKIIQLNCFTKNLASIILYYDENPELLFCENETNNRRLYNSENTTPFVKDGINDYHNPK